MILTFHPLVGRRPSRTMAPKLMMIAVIVTLVVPLAQAQANAKNEMRSGKEIVDTVCAACHAAGVSGAPKIGDRKAWSKRAAKGLTGLTEDALKGIRQMPPHGGSPDLTDFEIQRAITHMVNQSGGHWSEPINKAAAPAERSAEQIVRAQCAKCHATGAGGAPKIGDRDAWIPRLKPGLDTVVRSAINGHGSMPARGGMANLTDRELRSAIVYMFTPAGPAPK